jgi:hypothetical protein
LTGFTQALLEDYPDKPKDDTGRSYLEQVRKASLITSFIVMISRAE